MENKCEWKKRKVTNSEGDHRLIFYPCDAMSGDFLIGKKSSQYPSFDLDQRYCKYCGADIRKPDTKIKRKGIIMENIWKEFEIGNLPHDILTGNYEFHEGFVDSNNYGKLCLDSPVMIIQWLYDKYARNRPCHEFHYRKPEEKPLIVKSGGTWVAHYKSINYLMLDPEYNKSNIFFKAPDIVDLEIWKPFSEITIDDEIAKLRPMVVSVSIKDEPVKLYGIEGDGIILVRHVTDKSRYRLATARELQEADNVK